MARLVLVVSSAPWRARHRALSQGLQQSLASSIACGQHKPTTCLSESHMEVMRTPG